MIASVNWALYASHCSEHLTSITSLIICVTRHILLALSHSWGIWAGDFEEFSQVYTAGETVSRMGSWTRGLALKPALITMLPVITVHPPFGGETKTLSGCAGGQGRRGQTTVRGACMFPAHCLWSLRLGVLFAGKPLSCFSITHMSFYNQETQ